MSVFTLILSGANKWPNPRFWYWSQTLDKLDFGGLLPNIIRLSSHRLSSLHITRIRLIDRSKLWIWNRSPILQRSIFMIKSHQRQQLNLTAVEKLWENVSGFKCKYKSIHPTRVRLLQTTLGLSPIVHTSIHCLKRAHFINCSFSQRLS